MRSPVRASRWTVKTLGLAVGVALASLAVPPPLAGQAAVGLHAANAGRWADVPGRSTGFLHVRSSYGATLGSWEGSVEGDVWVDLDVLDASLVAVDVVLARAWDWGEVRLGSDTPDWGLTHLRSPASTVAPDGILWSLVQGPPLAQPLVGLAGWTGAWDLELLLLPLRRPFHAGRLAHRTWAGVPVNPPRGWEPEVGYGARVVRSFAVLDATLWWLDASDRRPWVVGTGSRIEVGHPRARQLGWGLEWVMGEAVLRAEGSFARRSGSRHTRAVAGVEWFVTPYLSLLLEQGVASDHDEAASPLVDDTVVSLALIAETLRFRGGLAVDPGSGTLHHWSALRWIQGATWAIEAEWVDARGAADDASPTTLRQPRVFRVGLVWYP